MCYVVSCRSRLSCFHMLSCVVVSFGHCVCVDHAPLVCVGMGWGKLGRCGSMLSRVGCGLRWDDVGQVVIDLDCTWVVMRLNDLRCGWDGLACIGLRCIWLICVMLCAVYVMSQRVLSFYTFLLSRSLCVLRVCYGITCHSPFRLSASVARTSDVHATSCAHA